MNYLFLLLMAVLRTSVQWETLTESVTANNFGSCPWIGITTNSNLQPVPNNFYAVLTRTPEEEMKEYNRQPAMLTKSNPMLGEGTVNGVPQGQTWANRKTNNWQLAPDHPLNDKPNCLRVAKLTGVSPVEVYERFKKNADFYVIAAVNGLIHESGIIGLPCGYFQPLEGCETYFKYIGRKWWNKCTATFTKEGSQWPVYWKPNDPAFPYDIFNSSACKDAFKGSVKRYAKVFVITANWDHNYHHFLIDSASRLVRHVDFLRQNPDIMIHIRRGDQYADTERAEAGVKLRTNVLQYLGLNASRLISGVVLADEVYLARASKCNYPIASGLQIRKLASVMKRAVRDHKNTSQFLAAKETMKFDSKRKV
jgi:hypothetical protein